MGSMVAENRFRSDLYYRLNVFPLDLPPLRRRSDDIPRLVRHFTQRFARRMGRAIETIPSEVMDALVRYPWPGNVRELQNVIERAVLLAEGEVLSVDLPLGRDEWSRPGATPAPTRLRTMEEMERDYIAEVLQRAQGAIAGKGGAAELLGLPPSTLRNRMKKLGLL
jgi:formate hydrogenlyase transcriptional activator